MKAISRGPTDRAKWCTLGGGLCPVVDYYTITATVVVHCWALICVDDDKGIFVYVRLV